MGFIRSEYSVVEFALPLLLLKICSDRVGVSYLASGLAAGRTRTGSAAARRPVPARVQLPASAVGRARPVPAGPPQARPGEGH